MLFVSRCPGDKNRVDTRSTTHKQDILAPDARAHFTLQAAVFDQHFARANDRLSHGREVQPLEFRPTFKVFRNFRCRSPNAQRLRKDDFVPFGESSIIGSLAADGSSLSTSPCPASLLRRRLRGPSETVHVAITEPGRPDRRDLQRRPLIDREVEQHSEFARRPIQATSRQQAGQFILRYPRCPAFDGAGDAPRVAALDGMIDQRPKPILAERIIRDFAGWVPQIQKPSNFG